MPTQKYHKIDIITSDLYYIGRGYVEDIDLKNPPKLLLMLPIKQGSDNITKAFRFLLYQYENYWALYSIGLISKIPLVVTYQGCFYDRLGVKGYVCSEAVENVMEYLTTRHFHKGIDVMKALATCGNPNLRTFVSYVDRDMAEKSIRRAWLAARIISDVSRPSEMSEKIDRRIAEIYTTCKNAAEEANITLQSPRNCKME